MIKQIGVTELIQYAEKASPGGEERLVQNLQSYSARPGSAKKERVGVGSYCVLNNDMFLVVLVAVCSMKWDWDSNNLNAFTHGLLHSSL